MIKQFIQTIVFAVLVTLYGCQKDALTREEVSTVPAGYVAVTFEVEIPDMVEVSSRAVDPNATGVENIRLFCFDKNGIFVSTATTTEHTKEQDQTTGYYLNGTFKATIVDYTRIVHVVANQNLDAFNEADFFGKSEDEVMTKLVASSEQMIYWARVEAVENQKIADVIGGKILQLVRNQAKVTVPANSYFTVTGFCVCNTSAYGTIAPYNRTTLKFDWIDADPKYITLPDEPGRVTVPREVDTRAEQYVFETDNRSEEPVSVIVRGYNTEDGEGTERYYRVLLLDQQTQEPMQVIRNHVYEVEIGGKLSSQYGYGSIGEALEGAAVNNAWISISDEIKQVQNATHILSVDQTAVVVIAPEGAGEKLTVKYKYTTKDGTGVPAADAPEVSWVAESNNVANPVFSNNYDSSTGEGTIDLSLLPIGNDFDKREGVLLIKKGKLQRTVKVTSVKRMQFSPAWISTEVYSGIAGQKVTMMFTIPDNCPAELFPLRVLISINHMDVRSASGMKLETITQQTEPEEYGADNGIGYKYVYEAKAPGVQRIYFRTVLDNDAEGSARIEQAYFETLDKPYTYSNTNQAIRITDLATFNGSQGGGFAQDEDIYYTLVPRKKNAFVKFEVGTFRCIQTENPNGSISERFEAIAGGMQDEFLLYSQNLDAYENDVIPGHTAECSFDNYKGTPGTGGRLLGFYPIKPGEEKYVIYLYTNKAESAEVVRIASNQPGSPSIKLDASGNYTGNTYRSITFELANYDPFKFASKVDGTDAKNLTWTYEYGREVDVEFDVTSFIGTDNKVVDPFGTEFKVYIDAPMLTIDESRRKDLTADKFYEEKDTPGRFVYVVDAEREKEYAVFGSERKVLPFKTNKIVSAGSIKISADPEIVTFDEQVYTVENELMQGTIQYKDRVSGETKVVGKGEFVSFERSRDATRIGSVSVGDDGSYTLQLRSEYSYAWDGDEKIEFHYRDKDRNDYAVEIANLATLFKNGDVVLE